MPEKDFNQSHWIRSFASLGWILILLGWLLSSVFANGGELWKVSAMVPLIAVGSVLCLFGSKRGIRWLDVVVCATAGYFLVRGSLSEVYDIARYDILLIGMGALSYFSSSSMMSIPWGRRVFIGFLGIGVVLQSGAAGWQLLGDREWRFLREDTFQSSVSGFFYLRNYLAGFLELVVPALLAWLFLQRKLNFWSWTNTCVIALGVICTFFTLVRSGFTALALSSILVLLLAAKFGPADSLAGRAVATPKRKGLFAFIGAGLIFFFFAAGRMVFESRGGGEAAAMNLHSRLKMAGIAFDTWQTSPIWGVGGNGFSYFFPQLFNGLRKSFGDASKAHNEYLQVLSDYGIVGLTLVMSLWTVALFVAWGRLQSVSAKGEKSLWLPTVVFAVLLSEALRATLDFNLHALPNFLTLSLLVGGLSLGAVSVLGLRLLRAGTVLGLAAFVFWVAGKEVQTFPTQVELHIAQSTGNRVEVLKQYSLLQERSPEFSTSRKAARLSSALYLANPTELHLERALRDWKLTATLHPYDGETASSLARVYGQLGDYEKADSFFRRAIALTGRREKAYGALYAYASYLAERSHKAWLSRSPEQAFGWILMAKEVLKRSSYRGEGARELHVFVNNRIAFFKEVRITPEEVSSMDWEEAYEMALDGRPASLDLKGTER